VVQTPSRIKSKTENWHLLLPWLTFTIKGLNEMGYHIICGVVLWCTGILKPGFSTDQLQQITDLTTTVVHSYKLLLNNVKPVLPLSMILVLN